MATAAGKLALAVGRWLVLGALLGSASLACVAAEESSGACVAACTGCGRLCWNDQTRAECRALQAGAFSSGKSCEDIGYTRCCDAEQRLCAEPGTPCPSER